MTARQAADKADITPTKLTGPLGRRVAFRPWQNKDGAVGERQRRYVTKIRAPAGCYWRNRTLWGRVRKNHRDFRWSLETDDVKVAAERYKAGKSELIAVRRGDAKPNYQGALYGHLQTTKKVRRRKTPKSVYFIECDGHVKIGVSNCIGGRLKTLATSHHKDLTLLAAIANPPRSLERELHRHFARYRVRGEWFTFSPEIRAYIDNIRAEAA